MSPDPSPVRSGNRPAVLPLATLLLATLAGCATLHRAPPPPDPGVERMTAQSAALDAQLFLLRQLVQSPPDAQADLLATAQKDFETDPSPEHQLRYALILATPGHAGTNPAKAEQLLMPLTTLADAPFGPGQQALAVVALQNVQLARSLAADAQRLQAAAERSEHDKSVANSRRLQSELDENAHLRKELEDARSKLDAIANIERGLARPNP